MPQILLGIFSLSIFGSALLLFSVQPLISKMILPWLGGAPSVWTVCMLFFQLTLLLGYGAAHIFESLRVRWIGLLSYLLLLGASLLLLDIIPDGSWRPNSAENPTRYILALLTVHLGLPFFVLATSSPLLQAWAARTKATTNPYRLYALSLRELFAGATLDSGEGMNRQARLWTDDYSEVISSISWLRF